MLGTGLPVSMYTTKTAIDKCRFNVTQLKEFVTFSVKHRYQLNYFICIKDNAQTIISLKLNLLYFFIYCCHHHERQTTCIDIFLLSDREWGPNTSIYSEEIVNLRIELSESPIHLEKMKKNKKKPCKWNQQLHEQVNQMNNDNI